VTAKGFPTVQEDDQEENETMAIVSS